MDNSFGIVDYGVGNLLSVVRAFQKIGIEARCTSDPVEIGKCTHLVLPGVGAFGSAIGVLSEKKLDRVVKDFASSGRPLLGICLGMQLLFEKSLEFGEYRGLGLIEGAVLPISRFVSAGTKVPSIGWKRLDLKGDHRDTGKMFSEKFFYFVHSFMGMPSKKENLVATYTYGNVDVTAVVKAGNVTGVQFHPEKSGEDGLNLLREFAEV